MAESRQREHRIPSEVMAEARRLVERYRDRCLWFLDPRVLPETPEDALRILGYIERYGDREAFVRSEALKPWLLQLINERSAG
jgi:hypothetical protein